MPAKPLEIGPLADDITVAVERLRNGGVVALPTETVYGLAANAFDEAAVGEIFSVKGRPSSDPLIVHIADFSWLAMVADRGRWGKRVQKTAAAFWPGPLTMVLWKKDIVPDSVTAGLPTVAVRCPRHPLFQKILRMVGFPLAAPSANPFGYVSPTEAAHVRETLGDRIDVVVDGGKCAVGLESTILDLTVAVPKILRPGAVTADEIAAVLGEEVEEYRPAVTANPKAPGQLKQHYCTHTRLVLFDHGCRKIPGLTATTAIVFNAKSTAVGEILHGLPVPSANVFWLSEAGDHATIGSNLFATLRHLDRSNFSAIFCERPERHGLGVAIDDRLLRAAAKFSP